MVARRSALWLAMALGGVPLTSASPHAQTAPVAPAPVPPALTIPPPPIPLIPKTVMGHTFTFAPLPVPNGYDVLRQAALLFAEPTEEQMQALGRKDLAAQRAFVAANQEALGALQQGLQFVSRVPPPHQILVDDSTVFTNIRGLARLLVAESAVQAADGDLEGAANTALDAIWFSQAITRGSTSLALLMGSAADAIARAQLWSLLPRLNAEQTHLALDRLRFIERYRPLLAETLRVEQFFGLQEMQKAADEAKQEVKDAPEDGAPEDADPDETFDPQKLQQIADQIYDFWESEIKASAQPYRPPLEPMDGQPTDRPAANFGEMLRPTALGTRLSYERNRASQALLIAGLALRAYQLDKGALPATLEQLTPTYLPKPLTDTFTAGESFHYKREGETFTLYSVGPDGKDDGGIAINTQTQKGDLVAPLHTFAA